MDFAPTYTPEQEKFRVEVGSWLEDHAPRTEGDLDSPENYEKFRQLGRDLGQRGWLRPTAPPEYGGGGMGFDEALVLYEELNKYDLSLPPYYDSGGWLGGASILVWGTEEQKQRFLPPIFNGDVVTWQLLTGPEAGSDLAGTQTDAIRDGDDYVINGQKIYVGGSNGTDNLWTLTRTDPDGERHKNVSWFMIPADLPGITIRPMDLLGDGGEGVGSSVKNTVYFDNVRVPAENLVGGENKGWDVATTHLELEHGAGGSVSRNLWFERALGWARQQQRNGAPLVDDPDARDRLVEIYEKTEIQRLFGLRNFWMNRTHQPMTYEGSQSSYFRKLSGLDITAALHDLFGPYALTNDPTSDFSNGTLDSYQRSAIVALHPGGTADVQKVIMARRIGMGRSNVESAGKTVE
jgi:alkylation response protein AidB-like acyl-CoA dehydrogenase